MEQWEVKEQTQTTSNSKQNKTDEAPLSVQSVVVLKLDHVVSLK